MPGKPVRTRKATSPKGRTEDGVFVWSSEDPEVGEVRIPLKFKMGILRAAIDLPELAFMFKVLDGVMGDGAQEIVDEMDALEVKDMFLAWQQAWQARNGASMGEALGSST